MSESKVHWLKAAGVMLLLLVLAGAVFYDYDVNSPTTLKQDPDMQARAVNAYGKLPLSFESGGNGNGSDVKFVSRGAGYNLALTSNGVILELHRNAPQSSPLKHTPRRKKSAKMEIANRQAAALHMNLIGAKSDAKMEGADLLPGKTNYLIGKDRSKWRTGIPQFARVRAGNVYDGIDLVYYGNQRQMEFDFEVAPGADPGQIQLGFEGIESLRIDEGGDLVLNIPGGELRQHKPRIYQTNDGIRNEIRGGYSILGRNKIGFELRGYDAGLPLIIDPIMSYSTYLGGSSTEFNGHIAVDSMGNAYVTGYTSSTDFPTIPDAYQTTNTGDTVAYIAKLSSDGNELVYSTYVGGDSDFTYGYGIAVNVSGDAFVVGATHSSDFPTSDGAFQTERNGYNDAFVLKLNGAGSDLLYSTFLGGSDSEDTYGIALDPSGNASITGYTYSTDFPVANAFQPSCESGGTYHAFVSKLNSAGTDLVFSTYLTGFGPDAGYAVAVDPSGSTYITGYAIPGFPTTPGGVPTGYTEGVFVAKFDPIGSLVYSTWLGIYGTGYGIAVDSSGDAYVTGDGYGSDQETANGYQPAIVWRPDAFVAKLNPTGDGLVYLTYLGGTGADYGYGIAVDNSGAAHIAGYTYSTDFPTAYPLQSSLGSVYGVYRTTDGGANWAPGNSGLPAGDVNALAVDPNNPSVIYAGLDMGIYRSWGIYRSSDGGNSWSPAGNGPQNVQIIAINPNNTAKVYAGTYYGVYLSTDSGISWISRNNGLTNTHVKSLVLSPSSPDTLYVGTVSGAFRTTDGGNTWSAANTGLPYYGPQSLAIDPTDSRTAYATVSLEGIYKTTDGGENWYAVNSGLPFDPYVNPVAFSSLVLDPASPGTLYFLAPCYNDLYKTTDGGGSWNSLPSLPPNFTFSSFLAVSGTTPTSLYYVGADSISRTTDGGSSWSILPTTGMAPERDFSALGLAAGDLSRIYAGVTLKPDAFIARLDPSGSFLKFSTYLGGNSTDYSRSIATDRAGNSYIAGYTVSSNFPITQGSFQSTSSGYDAFLAKISRAIRAPADFEFSGKNNKAVYRTESGVWYSLKTDASGNYSATHWGTQSDIPVAEDYDGDGKTDIAVWRPSEGAWYALPSASPGSYTSTQWGLATDKPVPGDYDGDGKADIAVWRPASGVWYIMPSATPGSYTGIQWGLSSDTPVPADYDGDGKTDIAIWRPSEGVWYMMPSATPGSYTGIQWGLSSDTPVPADYDGDGKTDIAVWRPGEGAWYALPSASPGEYTNIKWGISSDKPASGDYDGDGKTDIAVWRPGEGMWYVLPSSTPGAYTATRWGIAGDIPISSLTSILQGFQHDGHN